MHCASCALVVEQNLENLRGMIKADVDYGTGKATIEFDDNKTDLNKIAQAIKDAGYGPIEPTETELQ